MGILNLIYLIKEGFKNLWVNRSSTILSIGVFLPCLIVSGCVLLFELQIDNEVENLQGGNLVMVYLENDISTVESIKIRDEISAISNTGECLLVTKEDALIEIIKKMDGGEDILGSLLEDNPLPNAIKVTIEDIEKINQTQEKITTISGVASIRGGDADMAGMIVKIKDAINAAGIWLIIVLFAVSLSVMMNTIKSAMQTRQKEINIMKAVGATNSFIRIPFFVEGILLGLISSGLAYISIKVIYDFVCVRVNNLFNNFLQPFSAFSTLILAGCLGVGAFVGLISGAFSIGRFLKRSEGESDVW